MLQHASYQYPSEWVPVFEVLLAGLLALWLVSGLGRRFVARLRFGRPQTAWGRWTGSLVVLGLLGLVGSAAFTGVEGFPVPRVSDEISYLLAADTFAHGRLANPVPPRIAHFTPEHVLVTDTVMVSKYPPAQGMVLALGQWLGHPGVGLWLLAGLLPLAVGWALLPWMPSRWAWVGAFLVLLRLGWGSYWNHSYWGGSLAAIGGALVLGAWGRTFGPEHQRCPWAPVVGALGIAILANSRPFEGALAVLGFGVAAWLSSARTSSRAGEGRSPKVAAWVAGVTLLIGVGCGMAWSNQRVTGDPWTFPHARYAEDGGPRNFVWQLADPADDRSAMPARAAVGDWLPFALLDGARDVAGVLFFCWGMVLLVPVVVGARWLARRLSVRAVLWPVGLVLLGHGVTTPWLAHYSAPLVAPLTLIAVEALRSLATLRVGHHRLGSRLALGALMAQALLAGAQLPAHRADPGDWSVHRARIDRELRELPGKHLLVVEYPRGRDLSWSWNGADPDNQAVVWADSLGPDEDQRLLEHFAGRTVWRLRIDLGLDFEREAPQPTRLELGRPEPGP